MNNIEGALLAAYKTWQDTFPAQRWVPEQEQEYIIHYGKDKEGKEIIEKRRFIEKAHFDGNCCLYSHDFKGLNKYKNKVKCPRTDAWLEYVRLRDMH